jgi:urease accessory protein
MHGLLDVTFERRGEKTVARVIRQRAPLKVLRPFYPEGASPAHLYILNVAGGVLAGDQMEVSLRLESGAKGLVAVPSATKVYSMPSGEGRQKICFRIGTGSVLEYLPEPLLPFSDSAFLQETNIFLEEGATLFWSDILGPGRSGSGESFGYRLYDNRVKIKDNEGLISQESFCLMPGDRPLNVGGVMGEYSHLGSIYIFCKDELLEGLLNRIRSLEEDLSWGVSLLTRRGLVVRALAHDTPVLQDFFVKIWSLFRRRVLGRSLPPVRRY